MQLHSHGDTDNIPLSFMRTSCWDSIEEQGGYCRPVTTKQSSSQERNKIDLILHGCLFVVALKQCANTCNFLVGDLEIFWNQVKLTFFFYFTLGEWQS